MSFNLPLKIHFLFETVIRNRKTNHFIVVKYFSSVNSVSSWRGFSSCTNAYTVHPHGCGEYCHVCTGRNIVAGSSPRVCPLQINPHLHRIRKVKIRPILVATNRKKRNNPCHETHPPKAAGMKRRIRRRRIEMSPRIPLLRVLRAQGMRNAVEKAIEKVRRKKEQAVPIGKNKN